MTGDDMDALIATLSDAETDLRAYELQCGARNDLAERDSARQAKRLLIPLKRALETWQAMRALRADCAVAPAGAARTGVH